MTNTFNKIRRCTLKDIAKEANVSITTVSAVLRNNTKFMISENTRKRVISSANKLNYHTNYLASRREINIGFMLPNLLSPNLMYKINTIIETLERNNYRTHIQFGFNQLAKEEKIITEYSLNEYNFVILAGSSKEFENYNYEHIISSDVPIISLETTRLLNADVVSYDRLGGFYQLANYLIALHHKNIGLLLPKNDHTVNDLFIGFTRALNQADIDLKSQQVVEYNNLNGNNLFSSTQKLIKQQPSITALMCVDDISALNAIIAIKDLGLRVPEDISVTGFDTNFIEQNIGNYLTTTKEPCDEIVKMVIKLIVDRTGNDFEHGPKISSFLPYIVQGQSTSKPKS